jgi:cytochrome o ubiquinol oxidase subunit 2
LAAATMPLMLSGCGGVMDPKGPVGLSEKLVLLDALAIMLVIVIPVIIATFAFAWWFRASNTRATYRPTWAFSGTLELIVWAIPALVVVFLGGIAWFGSHNLDPYRPLSEDKPVEVEVVSLDWKWLFIYPAEGVATVNHLIIPAGKPVHFRLTSSGVMNSFFVPQLGSQIYTMATMTTQLHLQADHPGTYRGISAQFSGQGFADMTFDVRALGTDDYAKWLTQAKASSTTLDRPSYIELATPSLNAPSTVYGRVTAGLFDAIAANTIAIPAALPGDGGQDLAPALRKDK